MSRDQSMPPPWAKESSTLPGGPGQRKLFHLFFKSPGHWDESKTNCDYYFTYPIYFCFSYVVLIRSDSYHRQLTYCKVGARCTELCSMTLPNSGVQML